MGDPLSIAHSFCGQYYELFKSNRAMIPNLYHPDVSQMDFEGDHCVGLEAIKKKIESLQLKNVNFAVTSMDAQLTSDNSLLVAVLGKLKTDTDPPNDFHQTFILKQSGANLFITNDVFRLGLHNF